MKIGRILSNLVGSLLHITSSGWVRVRVKVKVKINDKVKVKVKAKVSTMVVARVWSHIEKHAYTRGRVKIRVMVWVKFRVMAWSGLCAGGFHPTTSPPASILDIHIIDNHKSGRIVIRSILSSHSLSHVPVQGKAALPILVEAEMVLPLTLTNHNYH